MRMQTETVSASRTAINDEDDDIYPRFDGRNGADEVYGIDNDCDDVIGRASPRTSTSRMRWR